MPARFVSVDRDTPMLLPPDLREWEQLERKWNALELLSDEGLEARSKD